MPSPPHALPPAELVRAVLAEPPARHLLGPLLARVSRRPAALPQPADPVERWRAGHGVGRLAAALARYTPAELERLAYARVPDALSPTKGSPAPEVPFEELWEVQRVLESLAERGRTLAEMHACLVALRAARPLLDHRPPEDWSAAELVGALAQVVAEPGGAEATRALCAAAHDLWTALGRTDRIDGLAELLRAVQEAAVR